MSTLPPREELLPREVIVRLHNEPFEGVLALGGPCSCPVCQPSLHVVNEEKLHP